MSKVQCLHGKPNTKRHGHLPGTSIFNVFIACDVRSVARDTCAEESKWRFCWRTCHTNSSASVTAASAGFAGCCCRGCSAARRPALSEVYIASAERPAASTVAAGVRAVRAPSAIVLSCGAASCSSLGCSSCDSSCGAGSAAARCSCGLGGSAPLLLAGLRSAGAPGGTPWAEAAGIVAAAAVGDCRGASGMPASRLTTDIVAAAAGGGCRGASDMSASRLTTDIVAAAAVGDCMGASDVSASRLTTVRVGGAGCEAGASARPTAAACAAPLLLWGGFGFCASASLQWPLPCGGGSTASGG